MKKYKYNQKNQQTKTPIKLLIVAVILLLQGALFIVSFHQNRPTKDQVLQTEQAVAAPVETTPEQQIARTYESKIIFMGDTMLARSIGRGILSGKDPFERIAPALGGYALRVANVETTIADPVVASTSSSKTYTFNAPLKSLEILKKNSIDVSVLANNHTGDFGGQATADMIDQFARSGLKQVGLGKTVNEAFAPLLVDVPLRSIVAGVEDATVKVAFISVNDIELTHTKVREGRAGGAYLDKALIAESIKISRDKGAQVVVVLPHWGIEYSLKQSARQTEWGRFFVDSGADVVIGSHPHVVQPTEVYKGKPIVYSLGNFIFDGMEGNANIGQIVELPIRLTTIKTSQSSVPITSLVLGDAVSIKISIDSKGFPAVAQ